MPSPVTPREILHHLLYVFFKRKWTVVFTFVCLMCLLVTGTYLIDPAYEATAQILVRNNPQQQFILFKDLATPGQANPKINPAMNLVEISTSRGIAEQVIRKFGLDRKEELKSPRDYVKYYLVEAALSPLRLAQWLGVLEEAPPNYLADAIEELVEDMQDISVESETEIINLTIWGPTPELASGIANSMAEILVEKTREIVQSEATEAHDFTETQVQLAESSLKQAEEALSGFMEREHITAVADEQKLLLASLDERRAKAATAAVELEASRAKQVAVESQLLEQPKEVDSAQVTGANPLVNELKNSLNTLGGQLASLTIGREALHPQVFETKAQIAELERRLAEESAMMLQSKTVIANPLYQDLQQQRIDLSTQTRSLEASRSGWQREIEDLERTLRGLTGKGLEFDRLTREAATHKDRFTTLKQKALELEVQRLTRMGDFDVRVVDPAFVPADADSDWPDWELTLIIGTLVCFAGALAMPFVLEYFNDTVDTPGQVENLLGTPVVGVLPESRTQARRTAAALVRK